MQGLTELEVSHNLSAGTSGCVVAGRLAEDPSIRVLVIEAGQESSTLENVQMPGGFVISIVPLISSPKVNINRSFCNLLGKETDWNVTSALPAPGINGRQIKLSRGKFVGGSSGCNGTICVRGSEQDYDDWGIDGWSGSEFFDYMKKVSVRTLSALWKLSNLSLV